ncbi:MAG: NAD+ synthase [Dehalococcoidia bacterium]|jgi:NAD+ synthase (glutamine-hydrolysing)|nr:NAD+ synthase [Chloroflexota bacterium]MDP6425385.1 NAD+ synthase [Dehalococcoidia bacterium]MDP7232385.1 NAD+ synthase [Dehalococcoidia bacterium]MDP7613347.1 NAD+ synthase [Dehalococcoidia bacterium]
MVSIRVAAAQINTTVGDIRGNVDLINKYINHAIDMHADIVAFPELTVPGYPPEDLVWRRDYIKANQDALKEIAKTSKNILSIIGFISSENGSLYNSAAGLFNGKRIFTYNKINLPNYGVFDEKRYFESGSEYVVIKYLETILGVNICEDLWKNPGPSETQASRGAQLIININSSPYEMGKNQKRIDLLTSMSKRNKCFALYVNQVGGQDELVFDGGNMLSGPNGELIASTSTFEENLLFADIDIGEVVKSRSDSTSKTNGNGNTKPFIIPQKIVSIEKEYANQALKEYADQNQKTRLRPTTVIKTNKLENIYKALILGTRDYVYKTGFSQVFIGVSGGIDSALVAVIAMDAIGPQNVVAVSMPSRYSSQSSITDAEILCKKIGVRLITLSIERAHSAFESILSDTFKDTESGSTEENIQSRIRGSLIMALANKFNCLVLTTGNKSEMATGYATLYGDMAGAFGVIKDVPKTLVYELAEHRNSIGPGAPIPDNILKKEPSAELKPNQKDSDTLPPYNQLDRIIDYYVEQRMEPNTIVQTELKKSDGVTRETIDKIVKLIDLNEYKRRQSPPGIKITGLSFGRDRRLPLATKW